MIYVQSFVRSGDPSDEMIRGNNWVLLKLHVLARSHRHQSTVLNRPPLLANRIRGNNVPKSGRVCKIMVVLGVGNYHRFGRPNEHSSLQLFIPPLRRKAVTGPLEPF